MKGYSLLLVFSLIVTGVFGQQQNTENQDYKKRVLQAAEVDFLSSYYAQDGENAAVTGGRGTEDLSDVTGTFVVSIPLNDDDVLTIDAGVSAYTSASSSNIDPFDGPADPFVASSGASGSDLWSSGTFSYTHNSNDRNSIWNAKLSVAAEYDYFSVGFGGGYSRLFNEKNTELSLKVNVYLDSWNPIYPIELRPFAPNGLGLANGLFTQNTLSGNLNYNPDFDPFSNKGRNSFSAGLGFSQILSRNMQFSMALDVVYQNGLLSTPFQRVYFSDVDDSFLNGFHLAEAIEQLPDTRLKIALGSRLHYFLNEVVSLRSFYRYYIDDWGIVSHTASLEIPVKITPKFTLYPSYRYYTQSAADYFRGYNQHLSSAAFFTSDFDLSEYNANQFGFGVGYTDIFTRLHVFSFGLKSIDVKYYRYDRNSAFSSNMVTLGVKFVMD